MKKKIKVSINKEMYDRLMSDIKKFNLSISRFNNQLIKFYLKNTFKLTIDKIKNEKIIQFLLDENLINDYFRFFYESDIKTETVFLRSIYTDYLSQDMEIREKIIKK